MNCTWMEKFQVAHVTSVFFCFLTFGSSQFPSKLIPQLSTSVLYTCMMSYTTTARTSWPADWLLRQAFTCSSLSFTGKSLSSGGGARLALRPRGNANKVNWENTVKERAGNVNLHVFFDRYLCSALPAGIHSMRLFLPSIQTIQSEQALRCSLMEIQQACWACAELLTLHRK